MKVKNLKLNVSAPFHCSLMKNATMVMQDALSEVVIQKPKIKFINNVNAKFVYNPEEIKKLLVEQVQSRVRWRESIGEASRLNLDFIIEIGPGRVLTGLNKRIPEPSDKTNPSLSLSQGLDALSGVPLNFVDNALIAQNPAIPNLVQADSVPPATITSASP